MTHVIAPGVQATWQVPAYETQLWLGRHRRHCVVIPVINEGQRIRNLLGRMAGMRIHDLADIIIVDGGSKDGSLELDFLRAQQVRGLILKTGSGKLSSQLRCAYAFALEQGYEGIVTIDGNDKDDPEAIPRFLQALDEGYDFVQASRFVQGGIAKNTPVSRDLAIRVLHAPLLSFSSGFHWTDTTQGFRAYSRRMLLDPAIAPFRHQFKDYELLAYLSHRVPQLGYRCVEVGTSRIYPKGEVPTKISAVRGNLKLVKTLLMACAGIYNQPGYLRTQPPPLWPIAFLCLAGLLFSLLAAFPGWMSPDSIAQYTDAKRAMYSDWHPVFMAWWWRQLDKLYAGPALFLLQDLLMYWAAWGWLASAFRRRMGRYAYLLALAGFWPGLLFPAGEIWKDIAFGSAMLLAWGLLGQIHMEARKPLVVERIALLGLGLFACGVKTNGAVVLPFLYGFWLHLEKGQTAAPMKQCVLALLLSVLVFAGSNAILPQQRIIRTAPFQYTQTYDLLALSVATGQNLLPAYVNGKLGDKAQKLNELYFAGGNNLLFYNVAGPMIAPTPEDLADMQKRWKQAVFAYPWAYLRHRLLNFKALLRWKESTTAVVAYPGTVPNAYGYSFNGNRFSDWLASQTDRHPWMFFPWIYLAGLGASMLVFLVQKRSKVFLLLFGLSAISFTLPHFLIAPAADYRYLYYACMVSVASVIIAVEAILRDLLTRFVLRVRQDIS